MRQSRFGIIVVMILSLVLTGAARRWSEEAREAASANPLLPTVDMRDAGESGAEGDLSGMDSYALGLLLGGLRGPLVMFLWSTSENEKSAHDLQDFDTKVEWIRLLQPEFDTVHLFEIWNKAYNVSVQMTNLPNKYSAILGALDYGDSVNLQRPDDINIIYNVGTVYAQKLGDSHEAWYYIRRMRQETQAIRARVRVTLPDALVAQFLSTARSMGLDEPITAEESDDQTQTATLTMDAAVADPLRKSITGTVIKFTDLSVAPRSGDAAVRRDQMDPMLDADGNILPRLLQPVHPRPANLPADAPWYDGSRLQYLKEYEPFPYGVPPQAIGYDYYRRSQMLQTVLGEQEIQTSNFVVDSRPGMELKFWGAEEGEEGRRAELRLFGLDDSGERLDLEPRAPGADLQHPLSSAAPLPAIFDFRPDPAAGARALESYALASRLYGDSHSELAAHLRRFPRARDTFSSHIDDDAAFTELYKADHDFLAGLLDPAARASDWQSAAREYHEARWNFDLVVLRYWFDDDFVALAYPKDPKTGQAYTRQTIDQVQRDQLDAVMASVLSAATAYFKNQAHFDDKKTDRDENLVYMRRCAARLRLIER
jgi:hypothetical protein